MRRPSIRTRTVRLGRGLRRSQAMHKAAKRSPGDFRGFKYNPKSGEAKLT